MSIDTDNDDFVVLDRFQEYIQKSKTFKQFQFHCMGNDNMKAALLNGRLFHVNTFSHGLEFLAVVAEDIKTGIRGTDSYGHEGLRRIITEQDEQIFDMCCRLSVKIKEKILKEAADLKINEIKILPIDSKP